MTAEKMDSISEDISEHSVDVTIETITSTLSIDIGIRHLGYSILTTEGLIFDIFDIEDTYKKNRNLCGRIRRILISSCKTLKEKM